MRNFREYRTIDKSLWNRGQWDNEPDKVQWIDDTTGLDCLIVRTHRGNLCGYVGVGPDHVLSGIEYDQECPALAKLWERRQKRPLGKNPSLTLLVDAMFGGGNKITPDRAFEVHGGITFSGFCANSGDETHGICHVPEEGRPHKVWWFGFDCAHCDDLSPSETNEVLRKHGTYRTIEYVKSQIESLAKQLSEV